VGEWVNIVQHPGGEPQKVALRENEVVDVFDDWMHYTTDTGPGSSGSPVLNDQWEVAALHHSGVPRVDDEGCPLLRTGEPWDGSTETEDLIDWVANEGVRVSRIVAWLEGVREDLDPDGRDLVDEMLEAPAPPVHESLRAGGADAGVEPGGSWIDGDGRLHLVVPLHVRVGLDLPVEPENREAEADHVSDAGGGDDRAGADGSGKDLE